MKTPAKILFCLLVIFTSIVIIPVLNSKITAQTNDQLSTSVQLSQQSKNAGLKYGDKATYTVKINYTGQSSIPKNFLI
mgnify:CR=1 FL=1